MDHPPAPPATLQRGPVAGPAAIAAQVQAMLSAGRQRLICADRDLGIFGLSGRATVESLKAFLLARRIARIQCLVDDVEWLDRRADRLRALQRLLPHALELRVAAADDPVGTDSFVAVDTLWLLDAAAAHTTGTAALTDERARVQAAIAGFDRRWQMAGHNLPVSLLGV
ncbi:MAG: hypothetical protein ACK5TK_07070 [Betaproteobacteria bacterium]